MSKVTMFHPNADVEQEVPKEDVDQWSDAGWLKSKPKKFQQESGEPAS